MLIAADSPDAFLGEGSARSKEAVTGKCSAAPTIVSLAKKLVRHHPVIGHKRSLREVAAEFGDGGLSRLWACWCACLQAQRFSSSRA
jgi:hypothetical protein